MDHTQVKDAADMAYWISISDPFNAPSNVAWLDRYATNQGEQVSEDGSHSPCEM